jgi:hypothetical protein
MAVPATQVLQLDEHHHVGPHPHDAMKCAYCGKPATQIDLCHGPLPVCDAHDWLGHQLQPIPPATKPVKPAKAKG